jgi:hypothetical protein
MRESEAIEMLKACQNARNPEAAHSDADNILCKFLEELGYEEVVEAYYDVPKWYC